MLRGAGVHGRPPSSIFNNYAMPDWLQLRDRGRRNNHLFYLPYGY